MALLPANPGQALWIGGAAGKNHANVGIGQGTSGGTNHTDFSQSAIEDGYTDPEKFFLNSDGNPVFRINASAGRTSTNTEHPRSECREQTANGASAAWDGRSAEHWLKARVRLIAVTTNRPWNCFGQIHGSSTSPNTSDLIRLQTEGTNGTSTNLSLIARRTPPGGSEIRTVLRTGYNVGTWFDYKIWMGPRNGAQHLVVSLDGVEVLDVTGMGQIDCYFKYGCYLQDNVEKGALSTDWGAVEFERGSPQIWHTGYPAPTVPVFTGGTDPGGGAGGGAGNDTQAPTVPQGLVGIRGSGRAGLSWAASTDNVGVDHYNISRYSASGAGGGSGSASVLGRNVGGADTTLSSADKMAASSFIAPAAGTLTSGHFRAWLSASGSTLSKMVVYADSGGAPGARLAISDEITITATAEGVRDYVFSGANQISVVAGTTYWVGAAWDDPGTPSLTYSRDGQSGKRVESTATYGTPPNPFGTISGTFTGPVDAWCDVVSGTGAGTGGGGTTSSFGKQTDGASSSASSADKTAVSSVTAAASGTLTAGHARAWVDGGSATTKCVVYANSSGAPGARLASSDPVTVSNTSEAVKDYVFSGANQIAIASGTTYWIGLAWADPGSNSLSLSRDGTASGRQETSAYAPTLFGTPTPLTGPIDVYVDITTATGGAAGGFALLATTTGTTYTDVGLTDGQPYVYTVSAADAAGNVSAQSSQVTVIPGVPDSGAPTVPTNLVATPGDRRVSLTWTASTDVDDGTPVPPPSGDPPPAGGPSVGQTTTFLEGFETGNFARWTSVQNHSYEDSAGGYDPTSGYYQTLVSAGAGHPDALRTEVRDGDTAVGSHERAELSSFGKSWNDDEGDERWYEFDVRFGETTFAPTWSGGSNDWLIFFQWHQVDDPGAPALAMSVHNDGKVYFEREPDSDFEFIGPVWTPVAGQWHHVVVHIKWSPNSSVGFIECHVDGAEKIAKIFRKTQYAADTQNYYVKLGTYRRNTVNGTTVVYHDNLRISGLPATTASPGSPGTPGTPAPTTAGVKDYQVFRGGVLVGTPTGTSYVDVDLTNGTAYSYAVAARDYSLNVSAKSGAVNATPAAASIAGVALLPGRLTNGKVELAIAWGADLAADESTWAWTDVTGDVRFAPGIATSLGRADESGTSNPATLTCVLTNTAHAYSLGTISAHYPYVRRNTPVRLRVDPGSGGGRIVLLAFADGFTPGWDDLTGTIPVVRLSASGTLRRLSQGAGPIQSAYRRVMTALPSVKAYWPMEEGKSSAFAYPVRGGTPFTYTGGSPSWAADDSFDCSAALPTLASAYGQAEVTAYPDTGTSQLRMLLSIPQGGLTDGTVLMHVSMTGTIHRWDLTYEITDGVEALGLYRYDAPPIPGTFNSSDPLMLFKVNGIPGRLSLDWTQSGADIIWTLSYTPATSTGANTAQFVRRTLPGRTAGIVSHFEINPHNASIGATIGHITVENVITSFFTDNDVLIAYAGETNTSSAGRLTRLCAENKVPLQRYPGPPADVVALDQMGPQLVAPLLDLLHECEVAGQGQLWDGRNAGLSYTTRHRRELGTVKLTVDAAAKQLAGDFQPVDDDQRDRNKVTVTRLHGATYTYEDVTGPKGTAAIGVYDDAVTVNCAADDSTVDFARWFVALGTVPGYRYPSVTVDLAASPSLAAAVLDIIPGERIIVTGLNTTLAGFPDSTVSLIVEGIAHELTTRSWRVTFACSPFAPWVSGLGGASLTLIDLTVPVISGTATTGQTLTSSNGTWSATPDSYSYQWKRAGSNIAGATASTYLLVSADVGNTITVTVTATKSGYTSGVATSASVTPSSGSGGTLTNTGLPTISGTTTTGQTLTSSTGTWSATPDSYSYQWKRAGTNISGATASTYVVVAADVGQAVTVAVTAIKATYTSGVATSASVTPTTATLTNSTVPTITGTAVTGQTLTSSTGTWSATPDSYSYQWKRAGSNIAGATASTYLLVSADVGNTITVTVTATKAGYTSPSATSAATGTVTAGGSSAADTFTRANSSTIGTTETGGLTWATSGTGTWDIISNKLRCTTPNTATGAQCVVNSGSSDGTFSLVLSSFTMALAGFTLRCAVDNTSAAYVAFCNFSGKFELMRRAPGGGFTTIATSTGDIVAGDTLSVTLAGSSITGKINGVTAWSVTNTAVTTGTRHGFFVYGSGSDTAQFDDFSIA